MLEDNKLAELQEVEAFRLNRYVHQNWDIISFSEKLLETLIDKYVRVGLPPPLKLKTLIEKRPDLNRKILVSLSKRTPSDFREFHGTDDKIKYELLDFLERKWDRFGF